MESSWINVRILILFLSHEIERHGNSPTAKGNSIANEKSSSKAQEKYRAFHHQLLLR